MVRAMMTTMVVISRREKEEEEGDEGAEGRWEEECVQASEQSGRERA